MYNERRFTKNLYIVSEQIGENRREEGILYMLLVCNESLHKTQ